MVIASAWANEIMEQVQKLTNSECFVFPSLLLSGEEYYTDKNLSARIDRAAFRVYKKLRETDIERLNISEYNQRYLKTKSLNSLFLYSRIMYHLLEHNPNMKNFLDYGGGTGILSVLAAELGIEEVYFNDIYDVSCRDARVIAETMGYQRKAYIAGDADSVLEYCTQHKGGFDAIASYDVLEHIYDLKKYFDEIKKCLNPNGILCMETGANSYNKKFRDGMKIHHLASEFIEREEKFGRKKRDSLKAYFDSRLEVIKQYLTKIGQELKEAEIIALAFLTRGKKVEDIRIAVDCYLENNMLPEPDCFFRYNTCDPYTGNWSEHVIDFEELEHYLETIGFRTRLLFEGDKENSSLCRVTAVLK